MNDISWKMSLNGPVCVDINNLHMLKSQSLLKAVSDHCMT